MSNIVDLTSRMDQTEALLEEVRGQIESCEQAMLLSRVAIGVGLATFVIVFTIAPTYNTMPVVLAAFTAVIGGFVWLGANKSTKDELLAKRADLEARQARLFDRVAPWPGGQTTIH